MRSTKKQVHRYFCSLNWRVSDRVVSSPSSKRQADG